MHVCSLLHLVVLLFTSSRLEVTCDIDPTRVAITSWLLLFLAHHGGVAPTHIRLDRCCFPPLKFPLGWLLKVRSDVASESRFTLLLSHFRPSRLPVVIYWLKRSERPTAVSLNLASKLSVWRLCVFNPTLLRPAHLEPTLANGSERPARCLGCDGDFIIFSFLFFLSLPFG